MQRITPYPLASRFVAPPSFARPTVRTTTNNAPCDHPFDFAKPITAPLSETTDVSSSPPPPPPPPPSPPLTPLIPPFSPRLASTATYFARSLASLLTYLRVHPSSPSLFFHLTTISSLSLHTHTHTYVYIPHISLATFVLSLFRGVSSPPSFIHVRHCHPAFVVASPSLR